jgi:nitrogen fixation/metabolism regulation signal transduction histidine kinase
MDEKKAILQAGVLITMLVMGIGVAFSFVFVRRMIRPIKAMSHTAMDIAHGNLYNILLDVAL